VSFRNYSPITRPEASNSSKSTDRIDMPDEFPTLEVVAALGVLALLIRIWLVASETRSLPPFAAKLCSFLRAGDRSAALAASGTVDAPALGRVVRELVSHVGEPPYHPEAVHELCVEQAECEQELARRAESSRARDLIVLAVLLSSMAFAALSHLAVSAWFQFLATAACALVCVGYVMRSQLRKVEQVAFSAIGEALAESVASSSNDNPSRPSLHSIDGGCTVCGSNLFLVAQAESLGVALPALGIHELRICKQCGLVTGQAQDPDALARGALRELSVAVDLDSEASSDDTEHDG
jgi:hypothetical protein